MQTPHGLASRGIVPPRLEAKTTASALLGLVLVAGMAFVTYYYHLHENDEVPATEGSPLAVEIRRLAA